MVVPTRTEADAALASYALPDGVVVHARGVARVAAEAARLLAAAGGVVDPHLVEVAAVLHDIDKIHTRESLEHGLLGGRWLVQRGWAELAEPVAAHPVTALTDPGRAPRGWEAVALSVADRHVAQAFVTVDQRIDDLIARYPGFRDSLGAARAPAHALEARLAAATGLGVEELVARLRAAWERGAA